MAFFVALSVAARQRVALCLCPWLLKITPRQTAALINFSSFNVFFALARNSGGESSVRRPLNI